MQPTTHRKRSFPPERMSKIDSALAQVEGIIAEMRRDADSSGQHYQHTSVLKQACALLEPPIALSTYYRYRALSSAHVFSEPRYWIGYLDLHLTGRSSKNGTQE
jgi:hypothetical protein